MQGLTDNRQNNRCVKIVYGRPIKEQLAYEDVFLLDVDLVEKIVPVEGIQVEQMSIHPDLAVGGSLELLCRLMVDGVRCIGQQSVGYNENTEMKQSIPQDEYAFFYAYLIRYHMDKLHERGTMDQVFQGTCSLMQQKGCFDAFQYYLDYLLSNEAVYERIAKATAPFLVLKGDATCGGVLQRFADDLAKALREQGEKVILLDGEENPGTEKEPTIQLEKMVFKGIIGFQAAALEKPYFRKLKGTKYQFWFDNPFSFQKNLRDLPYDQLILCQDGDHARWIEEYYNTEAIQFPPGGSESLRKTEERNLDVVFIGRYFSDEIATLDDRQREFYEYMITNPAYNFEEGIQQLLSNEKWKNITKDIPSLLYEMKPACRAVVGYYRNKVVESIASAGIALHVYGDDWKDYKGNGKENLIIHPEISVEDALLEYQKAKIGLNVMSWYKDGMTERIANIMMSKTVCVTDETKYLKKHLEENEEIVFYRLNELENLPIKIHELLQNDADRKRIAEKAYQKAKEEFSWEARAKELIRLEEERRIQSGQVRIYVATHVPFVPPENPIYSPLHVGKKGKKDLGYPGDDTGDNISDLNFLYGELTGLYWIWQNVWDVEYAGLCHYRRYFINNRMQAMNEREYLKCLEKCDAIVPTHMDCEDEKNYYEHYGKAHNKHDLDAVGRALKRLYPEYGKAFDQAMNGTKYYWGNLVVTKLEILQDYAKWLFDIFLEAGEEIDVSDYDDYHKRVYGFLSEQMFYVYALKNELKLLEVKVGVSAEKAETGELRQQLKLLVENGKRKEAFSILQTRLQIRPDLLLPGSDVTGELAKIYESLKDNMK